LALAGDHGKSDLVVLVNVDEHLTYKRVGSDLLIMEHLSLAEALSGYTQVVTHVSGHRLIKIDYPHPIFSDSKLVAENLGLPKSSSPDGSVTFGNLIIDLKVAFPDSISSGAVPQIKAALSISDAENHTHSEETVDETLKMIPFCSDHLTDYVPDDSDEGSEENEEHELNGCVQQ
jgi:DnaJ-class molecular chaperone